ncbi:hypothetical protein O9993_15290 [Vibrio lentus]|nr:hypothetical protein [Vibrio lentus]
MITFNFFCSTTRQLNENGFGMVHLDEFFMDSDYAQAELSLPSQCSLLYAQLEKHCGQTVERLVLTLRG